MIEVGRIVMKVAGRDAGKVGVIVKVLDNNYIMIDGEVRRRKCNNRHVELINKTIKIDEDADTKDVITELGKAGFDLKMKEDKKKEPKPRPKKVRKKKEKPEPKKTEPATKKQEPEIKTEKPKEEKKPVKKKTVKKAK